MKLRLSYFSEKTAVSIHNETVEIKAYQIIVWVSISTDRHLEWQPGLARIPAILDIGTNHNFAITERHLAEWTGIDSTSFRKLRKIRKNGQTAPLCDGGLWLHTDGQPFSRNVNEGIAVFKGAWPRLPVLGLRALTNSHLQTFIYGDRKQVVIRTPPKWYWPF